jgi:murein DD-endopeptidase MepM/ murein hydrolase activator NlpD
MARVFQEFDLSPTLLARILAAGPEARRLADVRPGQRIRIHVTADGDIEELVHERSSVASLRIRASGDGFEAVVDEKPIEVRNESATTTINSSLFVDGQNAGLSDRVIMEVAELFNWDIDFARELRPGDRFSVIYEARFVDGEKYRDGDILAAEFVNNGKPYRAIRYRDPKGITDYYSPDGSSKRKAFIKTPVDFTRISSRFTKKRWHPILKRWRSHKGVDYAAPTGTPVKAAGKGKVTFVGRQRGYGKMIVVQHGDRYTTVYGHLSRFAKGLKKGRTVSQSETIGYVGQTGLATGPHLHYEFRVNGKHIDPLSHKLPTAMPLPKRYMADFKRHSEPLVEQLNLLGAPRLAEQDRPSSSP